MSFNVPAFPPRTDVPDEGIGGKQLSSRRFLLGVLGVVVAIGLIVGFIAVGRGGSDYAALAKRYPNTAGSVHCIAPTRQANGDLLNSRQLLGTKGAYFRIDLLGGVNHYRLRGACSYIGSGPGWHMTVRAYPGAPLTPSGQAVGPASLIGGSKFFFGAPRSALKTSRAGGLVRRSVAWCADSHRYCYGDLFIARPGAKSAWTVSLSSTPARYRRLVRVMDSFSAPAGP